jgi:hypothetical protein
VRHFRRFDDFAENFQSCYSAQKFRNSWTQGALPHPAHVTGRVQRRPLAPTDTNVNGNRYACRKKLVLGGSLNGEQTQNRVPGAVTERKGRAMRANAKRVTVPVRKERPEFSMADSCLQCAEAFTFFFRRVSDPTSPMCSPSHTRYRRYSTTAVTAGTASATSTRASSCRSVRRKRMTPAGHAIRACIKYVATASRARTRTRARRVRKVKAR